MVQKMISNKFPLVSIVIPMFNAQEWIIGLLQSITNQSYKNIEVIVVNDGSTDSSLELVTKFSEKFSEIKISILDQKNSGVSVARNEGVRNSTGEVLAFVDSDDVWLKDKIERQVNELIESNVKATACSYAIFRGSDLKILDVVHPDWSSRGVRNWLLLRSYGGLLSSTLMLSRDAFNQTGPFRTDLSLSADVEFAWRLLTVTPVKLIQIPLVGYRLRPNQMHRLPDLLVSEYNKMIESLEFLQEKKIKKITLANLNLRLFLYRLQKRDFRGGLSFLGEAFRSNSLEIFVTVVRIFVHRVLRKLKFAEKKSFSLPRP